jgi:large subunit ribosomal protein L6
MSRIGRLPIAIPSGVKVEITDATVKVTGPKGSLARTIPPGIGVAVAQDKIVVSIETESKSASALGGMTRSLINNMVTGVSKGFEKALELVGVGYRAEMKDSALQLILGYSHPVVYEVPKGIKATVDKQTRILLEGIDRQLVGETAATIRGFKPPDPYKAKGIKYADEVIKKKIGKKGIK